MEHPFKIVCARCGFPRGSHCSAGCPNSDGELPPYNQLEKYGKFTAPGDHWNKFYNLWFIPDNRWTKESRDNKGQDPDKPFKLTIEEVIEWAIKLIDDKGVNELDYDIREVGPGNRGILVSFFQVTKLTTNVAAGKLTSQQQKNELEKAKEMAFFRASTPDNCPKCGAPANRCTYHPQVKTH